MRKIGFCEQCGVPVLESERLAHGHPIRILETTGRQLARIKLREYAALFDNDKPSAHRRFIELETELLDHMGALPAEGL